MIAELKYRLFVSMAQKAKSLNSSKSKTISHRKKYSIKNKHSERKKSSPISSSSKLSLKNQRRIKRLRDKKLSKKEESKKKVINILKQEVREHNLTRSQLEMALKCIKDDHESYKHLVASNTSKLKKLVALRTRLEIINDSLDSLRTLSSDEVLFLKNKISHLDNLIVKKENDLNI